MLDIGGAKVALKDHDDVDPSPPSLGGSPVLLTLAVDDADAVADAMRQRGARVVFAVDDHGYGFRDGRLEDPFGHLWLVSQKLG